MSGQWAKHQVESKYYSGSLWGAWLSATRIVSAVIKWPLISLDWGHWQWCLHTTGDLCQCATITGGGREGWGASPEVIRPPGVIIMSITVYQLSALINIITQETTVLPLVTTVTRDWLMILYSTLFKHSKILIQRKWRCSVPGKSCTFVIIREEREEKWCFAQPSNPLQTPLTQRPL